MKTTVMAGVCLLALVLTFTIAECGPSQEKRQASCDDEKLQNCIRGCETAITDNSQALATCKDNCNTAYDACNGANGGNDSGATAIAGATIFSTISALLVAVASTMN